MEEKEGHGPVSKIVQEGVQGSRGLAAKIGGFHRGGGPVLRSQRLLHRWRGELRDHGVKAFTGNRKSRDEESQLAALERKVDRQTMEIDFLLAACRAAAQTAGLDYPRLVYPYIEKEVQLATLIPAQRLCGLAAVSRAVFYR
jgi:hypothetical protein